MALIVDKHRPRSLDSLTYHHELSSRLQSLVRSTHRVKGMITTNLEYHRPRAATFLTSSSTVPQAQERRLG